MVRRYWLSIPILVLLVSLSVACGGGSPAPSATDAPSSSAASSAAPSQPESKPAPVPAASQPQPAPAGASSGAQLPTAPGATSSSSSAASDAPEVDLEEAQRLSAVNDVKSYRVDLKWVIEGTTEGGEKVKAGFRMLNERTTDPPGSHGLMEATGDVEGASDGLTAGKMETYEADGMNYLFMGDGWKKYPSSGGGDADSDDLVMGSDMAEIATQVEGAQKIGGELVNGRAATHYRFDKDAMLKIEEAEAKEEEEEEEEWEDEWEDEDDEDEGDFLSQADEAQIDVWIDNQYKIVIKYLMVASGNFDHGEKIVDGKATIEYEIKDINGNFRIEVPKDVVDSAEDMF